MRVRQRKVWRVAGEILAAVCLTDLPRAPPSNAFALPCNAHIAHTLTCECSVRQAGKYFKVKERKSCLTTELRAGNRHVLDGAKCPTLSAIHTAGVCLLPFPALAGCLGNVRAGASGAQMAYILAVNASIISETGGPCGPKDCTVRTACTPAPRLPQYLPQTEVRLLSAGAG